MASPTSASQYPWYPGQAAVGMEVVGTPAIFAQYVQKQGGQRSFPPLVTTPGTIAIGGTITNTTGLDCVVYMNATSGIGTVHIMTYNGPNTTTYQVAGTVGAASTGTFIVPSPGAMSLTYVGTLTWTWVAL